MKLNGQARGTARQVPRYLTVSCVAALANFWSGVVFYDYLGLSRGALYGLAVAMAYCVGMTIGFELNRRWTFRHSRRPKWQQARTYIIVSFVGLVLTVLLAATLRTTVAPLVLDVVGLIVHRQVLDVDAMAHGMAIGLMAFYSFSAHKWLTFHRGIGAPFLTLLGRGTSASALGGRTEDSV